MSRADPRAATSLGLLPQHLVLHIPRELNAHPDGSNVKPLPAASPWDRGSGP